MAEANQTEGKTVGSGGSKLVPLLLVVNMLLVAGVLYLVLARGAPPAQGQGEPPGVEGHGAEPSKAAPGPTTRIADFVVHLRNPESDRYARLAFEIEVATEADRTRLAGFTPRIRDAFITYLSDRTVAELSGGDAIARTKAALSERLGAMAPGVGIRALYVTDLVIQ